MNNKKLKENFINKNDGFIVQTMYLLFYFLERLSIFYWIRMTFGKKKNSFVNTYIFPEVWAVGNLVFAFIAMKILSLRIHYIIVYILFIYAFLRVVELFVYQINVLFFHRLNQYYWVSDEKKKIVDKTESDLYVIKSATRTIILLIMNMIEYIVQFSVLYTAAIIIFNLQIEPMTIFSSFKMFMNAGDFEEIIGVSSFGTAFIMKLIYFETIIGIFMNILCIARFINEMPQVKKIDN